MLKRLVGWFVLLPLSAVLIVFALANRQLVVVNFNPLVSPEALNGPGFGVPLFLVIYAVLMLGVLLGGVATWFSQAPARQEKRHWRREADRLHREIDDQRRTAVESRTLIDADGLMVRE